TRGSGPDRSRARQSQSMVAAEWPFATLLARLAGIAEPPAGRNAGAHGRRERKNDGVASVQPIRRHSFAARTVGHLRPLRARPLRYSPRHTMTRSQLEHIIRAAGASSTSISPLIKEYVGR